MKTLYLFLILFFFSHLVHAQHNTTIKTVVHDFLKAMENKDTSALDSLLHDDCVIFSTLTTPTGQPTIEVLHKASLMGFMRRAHIKNYIYHEELWDYTIHIEDNLATIWSEYTMFTGNPAQVSHCGKSAFTLAQTNTAQWQIIHIAHTRRKDHCQEERELVEQNQAIHQVLDQWHHAAATANEEAFYGAMASDCIYLGTDASERWLRDELREWAKFAFKREVAWAFSPSNRHLYWSKNKKIVWFEELLDTQMGICRGSGVLVRQGSDWRIQHYDLAIMVPNELVDDFLKLVKMGGLPQKNK